MFFKIKYDFMTPKIKILHFLYDLGSGGAESILSTIATSSDKAKFKHIIVCVSDEGFFGKNLIANDIKLYCLNASKKRIFLIFKLFKIINYEKPQIIQSWLYSPNLFSIVFKLFYPDGFPTRFFSLG